MPTTCSVAHDAVMVAISKISHVIHGTLSCATVVILLKLLLPKKVLLQSCAWVRRTEQNDPMNRAESPHKALVRRQEYHTHRHEVKPYGCDLHYRQILHIDFHVFANLEESAYLRCQTLIR